MIFLGFANGIRSFLLFVLKFRGVVYKSSRKHFGDHEGTLIVIVWICEIIVQSKHSVSTYTESFCYLDSSKFALSEPLSVVDYYWIHSLLGVSSSSIYRTIFKEKNKLV